MTSRPALLAVCLLACCYADAAAFEWKAIEPFVVGGRFQYVTSFDRESIPFAWNTTAQSTQDETRLMLDLTADTRYGDLYVKGSGMWDDTRPSQELKRFVLEQGDYLWAEERSAVDYSIRLFANERRFITQDMISPLLHDDRIGGGDALGARFDSSVRDLDLTLLYSALGAMRETPREVTYLRMAYAGLPVHAGISYAIDHPADALTENHAMFKAELSASHKWTHAVASYQQTGYSDRSVFFPSGGPDPEGGGVRGTLPENGALFAEVRVTSPQLGEAGRVRLIYSYASVGTSYDNDLSLTGRARETNDLAVCFTAANRDLRSRLAYGEAKRSVFEDDETRRWHASVWGRLINGLDFSARGEMADSRTADDDANFADLSVQRQLKKVRSGVHVMWKDVDTIYSGTRFAWDGLLAVSPNWGLYWRFLVSDQFDVGEMLYTRLSYRPNNHIFLTFSYGRAGIGDGPYLLEDQDVELSRFGVAQYTILLRGDF